MSTLKNEEYLNEHGDLKWMILHVFGRCVWAAEAE